GLGDDAATTRTGAALGTPAYMSPEQAAGRLHELGPRSDVYGLGATLYCLLSGQAPFNEKDVGAVLGRVERGAFPPPRQGHRAVPAARERVCPKGMALRPQERYATARDLAADVERWLADEPTTAYREPRRQRLGRWLRRHQTAVAAAEVLLLTTALGLAVG